VLITVLAGKGSEGGNSGLELGTGIVTGSEGGCGLVMAGGTRFTGRGFGLPFGFLAGVMVLSSSVISITSCTDCVDRFGALRVRILARSAMSWEKFSKAEAITLVVFVIAIGSELAAIVGCTRWSDVGVRGGTGSLVEGFAAGSTPTRLNIGLGRGLEAPLLENSEIVETSARGGGGKDEIVG
jgi:hypothetical protein